MTELTFIWQDKTVRVVGDPDRPMWVARDVAEVLDIAQPTLSLRLKDIPEDEKGIYRINTPGGVQEVLTVSEGALYELIFRSDKPEAKRFRWWVLKEVLPAIRKTGRYELNAVARDLAAENNRLRRKRRELNAPFPEGAMTLGTVARMHGLNVDTLLQILAENAEMRIIENFCKISQRQRILKSHLKKIKELVDEHRVLCTDRQLGLLDELDEFKPNLDLFDGEGF